MSKTDTMCGKNYSIKNEPKSFFFWNLMSINLMENSYLIIGYLLFVENKYFRKGLSEKK